MKKIAAYVLLVCLLISVVVFAGCTGNGNNTDTPTTETPTTEAPTTEAPTTEPPVTEAPTTHPNPDYPYGPMV